jgi:hypothetical protein
MTEKSRASGPEMTPAPTGKTRSLRTTRPQSGDDSRAYGKDSAVYSNRVLGEGRPPRLWGELNSQDEVFAGVVVGMTPHMREGRSTVHPAGDRG